MTTRTLPDPRVGHAGLTLAALLLMASASHAGGPYNVPSNLRQCMGYGAGPGYHAPLLLGSYWRAHTASQPVIYRKHPPKPNLCAHGFCGTMTTLGGYSAFETGHDTVYAETTPYGVPQLAPPQPTAPAAGPARRPGTRPAAEPASPSDAPTPEVIPLPRR